jgi:CheY-like chemotaxis protein
MSDERLRLVVAEDHARGRRAPRSLLSSGPDLMVVGEARTGAEAIESVGQELPDLAIIDARMLEMDGLQATARIKADWPLVRVCLCQ